MSVLSQGEKTRAGIVECALRLFYERGYDGTSFTDIVAASGLSRGNIYHYFKSKDDILSAVIQRHLAEFQRLLESWDAEYTDPRARLRAFVTMITGRTTDIVDFGCPIGSLNTELGKDRKELQKIARALFDLFRDWLTTCFTELGAGTNAESQALHILGRAQGIALIAHVYRDPALLERETAQLRAWIDAL